MGGEDQHSEKENTGVAEQPRARERARSVLPARLRAQPAVEMGRWPRDERKMYCGNAFADLSMLPNNLLLSNHLGYPPALPERQRGGIQSLTIPGVCFSSVCKAPDQLPLLFD